MVTGVAMTVIMTEPVLTLSMRNELKRFGNSGEESSVLKVALMRERGVSALHSVGNRDRGKCGCCL